YINWYGGARVISQALHDYPCSPDLHLYKALFVLINKKKNYLPRGNMTAIEQREYWAGQREIFEHHNKIAAQYGKRIIIKDGEFYIVPL
ncbi:MAG: hypothetical protein LBH71_02590, partial [Oscillospiraceae bacterium]|nr:hypothetical protein [Oscillospiraceae bacterium]